MYVRIFANGSAHRLTLYCFVFFLFGCVIGLILALHHIQQSFSNDGTIPFLNEYLEEDKVAVVYVVVAFFFFFFLVCFVLGVFFFIFFLLNRIFFLLFFFSFVCLHILFEL